MSIVTGDTENFSFKIFFAKVLQFAVIAGALDRNKNKPMGVKEETLSICLNEN